MGLISTVSLAVIALAQAVDVAMKCRAMVLFNRNQERNRAALQKLGLGIHSLSVPHEAGVN